MDGLISPIDKFLKIALVALGKRTEFTITNSSTVKDIFVDRLQRPAVDAKEYNQQLLNSHDYLSDLEIEITEQGEGTATLSLPYTESILNPGSEVIHGGVVATLIDHAGGVAIRTTIDDPDEVPHATTDLNVTYVRPATGDLTADATVIRSGRTMGAVAVEVSVMTPEGKKTVAAGRLSIHMAKDR